jgi:hypothetical protein
MRDGVDARRLRGMEEARRVLRRDGTAVVDRALHPRVADSQCCELMENVPIEVTARIERARGVPMDLWVEPQWPGGVRVVLVFHTPNEPPLGITVDRLFEAQWPFAQPPQLRVGWRMQSVVKDIRLSTVQSFLLPGSEPAVRVEVELEGIASLAFEGAMLHIGPVPAPKQQAPLRSEPELPPAQTFEA